MIERSDTQSMTRYKCQWNLERGMLAYHFVNVYSPCDIALNRRLWEELKAKNKETSLIFGVLLEILIALEISMKEKEKVICIMEQANIENSIILRWMWR